MIDGLKTLEIAAKRELQRLNWPAPNWVPPLAGPDGRPVLDVLVIGGGMCGQAAGFALMREGVRDLRIVERKADGLEGPWATFARWHLEATVTLHGIGSDSSTSPASWSEGLRRGRSFSPDSAAALVQCPSRRTDD